MYLNEQKKARLEQENRTIYCQNLSTNKQKYILQGRKAPEGFTYKLVYIEKILDKEYSELQEQLSIPSHIITEVTPFPLSDAK